METNSEPGERFLTVKDIQEYLGIAPSTVYTYLGSTIPAFRVGGRWLIDRREFEEYLRNAPRSPSRRKENVLR
jgi:excisionase family DNA binding protein